MTQSVTERLVHFFETLSPDQVARMDEFYSADVYFKDPFNEVRTLAQVQHIFNHMYVAVDRPRFVVTSQVSEAGQCFLTWDFEFYFKEQQPTMKQTIRGSAHLKFNEAGLVSYHRDYWDAAEELYEKLPLVGSLMRWLKKRVAG
ncbi:nuclear transport factor 2 family protein [Polaromonas eurypsychrophila]|uniref:Transcriptional regulator n=1 Tax=Polaromonas eurypsychrophila TaxID=1614635 RepID=A0A916S825_9BURK|nr:nuclear transport factor 2 family protein [Polaromonas eurypsychrophila]GGA88169.1 transcriptional regulator [Polaromonas eurypsychrophila]